LNVREIRKTINGCIKKRIHGSKKDHGESLAARKKKNCSLFSAYLDWSSSFPYYSSYRYSEKDKDEEECTVLPEKYFRP